MNILFVAYCLVWVMNVYLLLKNRKSKLVIGLTVLLLFLIFVSNSGSTGDAYKYKIDYELEAFGANWSEVGNEILKTLCKEVMGFESYNQYLFVLFVIGSILIALGMKRLGANYHAFFSVGMIFIFPTLVVAIRFFMAFAVFVFSIGYLKEGKIFRYVLCVGIAVAFHWSAIFLLIFLFSERNRKYSGNKIMWKSTVYIIGGIAIIMAVFTIFVRRLPFISLFVYFFTKLLPISTIKMNEYFGTITRRGFLILFVVYIFNFIYSQKIRKSLKIYEQKEIKEYAEFGYTINVLSAILLPLTVFNLVFYRLYMFQTFINVITLSSILNTYPVCQKSRVLSIKEIRGFLMIMLSWFMPLFFHINSISIRGMIESTFFAI